MAILGVAGDLAGHDGRIAALLELYAASHLRGLVHHDAAVVLGLDVPDDAHACWSRRVAAGSSVRAGVTA
ncbi:MAG: hypothetical protein M3442_09595, partial [Chloroflexota bacterium]|nr:hypothetical protein [Chloroflexota bacterium]